VVWCPLGSGLAAVAVVRVFSPTPENMDDYIRAARPRVQRLSRALELEAIRLLAELLADAAKERRGVLSGAFKRELRAPMPGATPIEETSDSRHGTAKRQGSRCATNGGK
jgi:hypothetical protein